MLFGMIDGVEGMRAASPRTARYRAGRDVEQRDIVQYPETLVFIDRSAYNTSTNEMPLSQRFSPGRSNAAYRLTAPSSYFCTLTPQIQGTSASQITNPRKISRHDARSA